MYDKKCCQNTIYQIKPTVKLVLCLYMYVPKSMAYIICFLYYIPGMSGCLMLLYASYVRMSSAIICRLLYVIYIYIDYILFIIIHSWCPYSRITNVSGYVPGVSGNLMLWSLCFKRSLSIIADIINVFASALTLWMSARKSWGD